MAVLIRRLRAEALQRTFFGVLRAENFKSKISPTDEDKRDSRLAAEPAADTELSTFAESDHRHSLFIVNIYNCYL